MPQRLENYARRGFSVAMHVQILIKVHADFDLTFRMAEISFCPYSWRQLWSKVEMNWDVVRVTSMKSIHKCPKAEGL